MTRLFIAMVVTAALATPALSQTRPSSDPGQAFAQQTSKAKKTATKKTAKRYVQRQQTAAKPCAVRTWIGCHGWDPDPNVRMMMQMDAHQYDD